MVRVLVHLPQSTGKASEGIGLGFYVPSILEYERALQTGSQPDGGLDTVYHGLCHERGLAALVRTRQILVHCPLNETAQ